MNPPFLPFLPNQDALLHAINKRAPDKEVLAVIDKLVLMSLLRGNFNNTGRYVLVVDREWKLLW